MRYYEYALQWAEFQAKCNAVTLARIFFPKRTGAKESNHNNPIQSDGVAELLRKNQR